MSGSRFWRGVTGLIGGAVFGAGLGAVAYFSLVQFMPRYTASVLYQLVPPSGSGAAVAAPGSVASHVATLVSDGLLERALEQPEVAGTTWAEGQSGEGGFVASMALPAFREIVRAEQIGDTNLCALRVRVRDPDDAFVIATSIDEVYRRKVENAATSDVRSTIELMERKIRELRQDVAALDVQIEQIVRTQKIAGPVEQSLAYQERALLISRLAELRAELAALPAPGEEDASPQILDQREPTEVVAQRLVGRIAALDEQVAEIVTAAAEVENLKGERGHKMHTVGEMHDLVSGLALKLERDYTVRVVVPAATPDERSFPTLWPLIGLGAATLGVIGLAVGLARSDP